MECSHRNNLIHMPFLIFQIYLLNLVCYADGESLLSKYNRLKPVRARKKVNAMPTDLELKFSKCYQVRDELEQLLDDDEDMADLYLSRKLAVASSPVSGSGAPNWFVNSPTIGSKISRTSRASAATTQEENDVEELEMLLEVILSDI